MNERSIYKNISLLDFHIGGDRLYIRNNDELTLPPGRISNPNYYNLGESKLSSNPIVNAGNRAPIFSNFRHNKLKSEFVF